MATKLYTPQAKKEYESKRFLRCQTTQVGQIFGMSGFWKKKKNDVQQQISKAWTYLYFGVLRKYLNFCMNYDKGMFILVVGLTFKYNTFKYLILDYSVGQISLHC